MEDKKKYGIIAILLLCIVCAILLFYFPKEGDGEKEENIPLNNEIPEQTTAPLKEEKVSGYHLVTYAQTANSNSFIQSLVVTASNADKIRFVIGTMDENSILQERTSFELACQKGENTFHLLKERHLLKEGEYLFMDIAGQDILYTQEGTQTKSLVQNENTKVSGKMIFSDSDYILPFKYTLETVKTFNALAIGNDITTYNGAQGLNATAENLDYYGITKTRLENTFETVNINRIHAKEWEELEREESKKQWVTGHLKENTLTDLDLVIFQLGDHFARSRTSGK